MADEKLEKALEEAFLTEYQKQAIRIILENPDAKFELKRGR